MSKLMSPHFLPVGPLKWMYEQSRNTNLDNVSSQIRKYLLETGNNEALPQVQFVRIE